MIDPDGIMLPEVNTQKTIKFGTIPEFDFITYDLDDEKEFTRYLKDIEKEVRGSFEYRHMIDYLKNYMGMNQCAFIQVSNKDNYNVKIEIHHYPFTLFDIVQIVYKKRVSNYEPIDVEMVAKEVTMLHYKLLVGLIPLSVTVHQLVHEGKIFIPVQNVLGRYNLFVDMYKNYCEPEQLETLNRIEKYSLEQTSELLNSIELLNTNYIDISVQDKNYQLPDLNNLANTMTSRIETIRNNNYTLPTLQDKYTNNKDTIEDRRSIVPKKAFTIVKP
jgi:hypothetical protein